MKTTKIYPHNKTPEWKHNFIIENARLMNDKELSYATCISTDTVRSIRLQHKIRRNPNWDNHERRLQIILMLEDFWCNKMLIQDLAKKYKIGTNTISRYISYLFKLRLDENTKIIVLQSKV